MSYTHLSIIERSKLEILHQQGMSARFIAKKLDRHPATICHEIRRQASVSYQVEQAQHAYEERRKACVSKGKWTTEQAVIIEAKLQASWSPEQIVERLREEGEHVVCFKTIYCWLYTSRLMRGALKVLRHKGKRQQPAEKRGTFSVGKTISQRPKEVRSRETFGHWEWDTVGKTRLYTAIQMPHRTALSMEIAFGVAASQYPTGVFQTATADRGKEFACYASLEATPWGTGLFCRSVFLLATRLQRKR